jgi:hydrocephalus-inducing protein
MSETGCAAGDIGAKFAWDTKALGKHFSIAPVSGFLAPGQVCKLSVKLQPQHEAPDLRADGVKCAVQGLKEPLTLTLTGSAVADSAVAGTLKFACAVRGTAAQAVSVQNSSPATWQLKPVVQNAFWSGAETLKVPPNGTAEYKVEYRPLTMAEADKPHAGSLFFPLPDGSGLLYKLEGAAGPPGPVDTVKRCAVCCYGLCPPAQ